MLKVSLMISMCFIPQDLFSFGDADGKGRDVRLQHPLGVAWNNADGKLYLVDSYNHKVISACLEALGSLQGGYKCLFCLYQAVTRWGESKIHL